MLERSGLKLRNVETGEVESDTVEVFELTPGPQNMLCVEVPHCCQQARSMPPEPWSYRSANVT